MKPLSFILFLILSISCIYPLNAEFIIQSGHIGSINSLVYHTKYKMLLSTGDDGTVKIWDPVTKKLHFNIQLSYFPIAKIVINPEKTQFTALIKTSLTTSKLIGYDWVNNKKLFSLDINEVPLSITYSDNGSYFIYLRTEWDSIIICDAATGQKLPYLKEGIGIASFIITTSDSKKTLIYKPSGKLIFKEIKSGNDLTQKPLNTLEGLKAISISSNTRFLAAFWEKSLVIIDLVSGNKLASIEQPNILSTSIRTDGKEILCLANVNGANQIIRYSFNGKELIKIPLTKKISSNITNCIYYNNAIFYSDTNGEIFYFDDTTEVLSFSVNTLLKITDIAILQDKIAFGTKNNIILISPDLLDSPYNKKEIPYTVYPNQFLKNIGLNFIDTNHLLIWNKENRPYKYYIIDCETGEIINEREDAASPQLQIDILKPGILILEQNGICKILDQNSYETIFKYTTSGINKVSYISENLIIAARSKIGETGSSLLQINPQTSETVPITTTSLLCYDIIYNTNKKQLYSLNISKDNAETFTSLNLHYEKGFEKERTLLTFAGEDLSASFALDEEEKYLYTSLGFEAISLFDGYSLTKFAVSKNIPRKLFIYNNLLLSINQDFSLSIWDRFTRTLQMELYLLKTNTVNWIVRLGDGSYRISEGAKDFLIESE